MELPTLYVHRAPTADMTNGTSVAPTSAFVAGGPTFTEYWGVITRRWRIIVAPVVAALMLTALVVFLTTPMYTAYSTVLIERQTPQVLDIRQLGTEEPEEADQDNFYGTQYKILESRSLAAQVIYNESLQTYQEQIRLHNQYLHIRNMDANLDLTLPNNVRQIARWHYNLYQNHPDLIFRDSTGQAME